MRQHSHGPRLRRSHLSSAQASEKCVRVRGQSSHTDAPANPSPSFARSSDLKRSRAISRSPDSPPRPSGTCEGQRLLPRGRLNSERPCRPHSARHGCLRDRLTRSPYSALMPLSMCQQWPRLCTGGETIAYKKHISSVSDWPNAVFFFRVVVLYTHVTFTTGWREVLHAIWADGVYVCVCVCVCVCVMCVIPSRRRRR